MIEMLWMLAGISRCVSSDLCPTNDELIAAIKAQDAACVQSVYAAEVSKDPNSIISVWTDPVKGVSKVICGEALENESRSVNCKYEVRYPREISYEVAKLTWTDGEWRIVEEMVVSRRPR